MAPVPAAQGARSEARENTGMVQGLESRLEEEVNLYRLEEAQGETRPESINTPSNGNQGRKRRGRREDKEQCLKQRPDEFMLGLVRKEKSLQHQAPACDGVPLQPGHPSAAPHPLLKPVPLSPTQLCSVFQQPHRAGSPATLPQHAFRGLIRQMEMYWGLRLDNQFPLDRNICLCRVTTL